MRWLSAQGTRLSQPQGAVGAASQTPWALFSFGEGARPKNRGLRGPQGNWTLSASNSLIATAAGLGLKNGTSVSGAVFAGVRAFDGVSPANSPLWYMVTFVHGAYVNQGSGINLVFQYGSPDSSAGIYLQVNSANVLTAVVANTALTGPTLVAGRAYAVVAGRDASGACWLWVNGAKVALGTGATAALSAQSSALYLSGGDGTNRAFQGVVNAFAMGSESPSEFGASISANPWQLFAPERRIWAPVSASGGGSSTNLVIQSALHAHTADGPTLTTDSTLAVSDALHAHSADALALGTDLLLAVDDASHAHSAEALTLDIGTALVVADATHGHTADGLTLVTDSALAVADALHGHTADNLTLTADGAVDLVIQDALHGHTADELTLSATGAGGYYDDDPKRVPRKREKLTVIHKDDVEERAQEFEALLARVKGQALDKAKVAAQAAPSATPPADIKPPRMPEIRGVEASLLRQWMPDLLSTYRATFTAELQALASAQQAAAQAQMQALQRQQYEDEEIAILAMLA